MWYFLIFILAYMEDVECYLLFPYIFYSSKKSKDIFFCRLLYDFTMYCHVFLINLKLLIHIFQKMMCLKNEANNIVLSKHNLI